MQDQGTDTPNLRSTGPILQRTLQAIELYTDPAFTFWMQYKAVTEHIHSIGVRTETLRILAAGAIIASKSGYFTSSEIVDLTSLFKSSHSTRFVNTSINILLSKGYILEAAGSGNISNRRYFVTAKAEKLARKLRDISDEKRDHIISALNKAGFGH